MSDHRLDPPRVVEITQIRGGGSARLGAIVLAGVLGIVVWVGVSGRPATVVPSSQRPEVAQVASPSPSASMEATATPESGISPTPEPAPTLSPPPAFPVTNGYAVLANIGNSQYLAMLKETENGRLSGVLGVPIPPPATSGSLELAQIRSTMSHDVWMTLDKWELRLEALSAASGREYVVLVRSVPARATLRNVPPPVIRGYKITVRAQSGIALGSLSVDIQVGPDRQIVGDRKPSSRSDCFWTGTPPPSRRPPLPTYDETSCG